MLVAMQNAGSNITPEQRRQRRETTQNVATGVGATGSAYASRNFIYGKLKNVIGTTTKTAKTIEHNTAEITGLFGNFLKNAKEFSADAYARLMQYKNVKYIGAIIKSPIVKKATGVFGGVMAFFVLVTGVQKAVDNGKIAIGDLKDKIA